MATLGHHSDLSDRNYRVKIGDILSSRGTVN